MPGDKNRVLNGQSVIYAKSPDLITSLIFGVAVVKELFLLAIGYLFPYCAVIYVG